MKTKNTINGYMYMKAMYDNYIRKKPSVHFHFDSSLEIFSAILNKASEGRKLRCLDFGCGKAYLRQRLKPDIEYIGLDEDKLNDLAHFHSLRELEGERFDYIVLSHVLEHMWNTEIKDTIEWCSKHAKNLLIATPYINMFTVSFFWGDPTHKFPAYNASLPVYLLENGYKIYKIMYSRCFLDPLKWLLCLLNRTAPCQEVCIFASKVA